MSSITRPCVIIASEMNQSGKPRHPKAASSVSTKKAAACSNLSIPRRRGGAAGPGRSAKTVIAVKASQYMPLATCRKAMLFLGSEPEENG